MVSPAAAARAARAVRLVRLLGIGDVRHWREREREREKVSAPGGVRDLHETRHGGGRVSESKLGGGE